MGNNINEHLSELESDLNQFHDIVSRIQNQKELTEQVSTELSEIQKKYSENVDKTVKILENEVDKVTISGQKFIDNHSEILEKNVNDFTEELSKIERSYANSVDEILSKMKNEVKLLTDANTESISANKELLEEVKSLNLDTLINQQEKTITEIKNQYKNLSEIIDKTTNDFKTVFNKEIKFNRYLLFTNIAIVVVAILIIIIK